MRLKRSDTLVFSFEETRLSAFDYVTSSQFGCDAGCVELLASLHNWTPSSEVEDAAARRYGPAGSEIVSGLRDLGAVMEEGSPRACEEQEFARSWGWGAPSAILHHAVTDRPIDPIEIQVERQREKAAEDPSPPLAYVPQPTDPTTRLPDPELGNGLHRYFSKRRTVREGTPFRMTLDALADLLFAGLGIVDWTENDTQRLPLKFTPSGGGRNPFDAFVAVRAVEGLEPGSYRYSGIDHSLTSIDEDLDAKTEAQPRLSDLMGGQGWADGAACVIVLVANFERSMWKYEGDDNAYRVVLIEAGHIGQNTMLMAADHGLSACPSAALDHALIARTFGLRKYGQSPIYAMAVIKPDAGVGKTTAPAAQSS